LLAAEGLNVMMIALVEEGLFNGYGVDDILLVG
jgi:hypothetical protein